MTGPRPRGMRTGFRLVGRTLVIDLGIPRPVLSSAVRGGGLVRARYILNHQVQANPMGGPGGGSRRIPRCTWGDPSRDLGELAGGLGVDRRCVGLMTAVPLTQLVVRREAREGIWVEGFITVGVTNAVKAGEPPPRNAEESAGTINIILVTNARLSSSAMVGAVQVATEAKTGALLACDVPSWTGQPGATGTGTDAVVVCSGDGTGPRLRYSGTHTQIGSMIGRLVSRGVLEGLRRSARWRRSRPPIRRERRDTRCWGDAGAERK